MLIDIDPQVSDKLRFVLAPCATPAEAFIQVGIRVFLFLFFFLILLLTKSSVLLFSELLF